MPVIALEGEVSVHVSDTESVDSVAARIDNARTSGGLIAFLDARTPPGRVYIDPDRVIAISDDA